MAKATARHILVETEEQCEEIKKRIEDGGDFAELAKEHSKCPSNRRGGDLGEFSEGQMVKEFDEVVFSGDLGMIHGPIQTQFGFHLIEITSRS
jgi:peptidyl-prolyl cis-trans isomerase C